MFFMMTHIRVTDYRLIQISVERSEGLPTSWHERQPTRKSQGFLFLQAHNIWALAPCARLSHAWGVRGGQPPG